MQNYPPIKIKSAFRKRLYSNECGHMNAECIYKNIKISSYRQILVQIPLNFPRANKPAHVSWSDLENMMNFDHFHIPNTHQEFTFLCSANCCGVLTVLWQTSYVSHTTRHTRLTRVNMVFLLSRMGWLGCIAHSTWLFQSPFSRTENNLEVIFKKSHIKYEFFDESFYFSKL